MKKIALYWQILIALVIGVMYGIFFAPYHKITDSTISELKKFEVKEFISKDSVFKIIREIPEDVIKNLEKIKDKKYSSETIFNEELKEILGAPDAEEYKLEIKQYSYKNYIELVSWMGDLFMRALKMVIVPLVLTSIISGITNIGSAENLGRLGLKTMSYYVVTSTLAILTGLFFVNIIQPGSNASLNLQEKAEGLVVGGGQSISDTLMQIVPKNIFQAMSSGNMLSIIFFALLFGFFITKIEKKYNTFLVDFFNASFEVMMKITKFIIMFTPLGIFGIVAKVIADNSDNLDNLASTLGLYMLAVLAGLAFHALVSLPLMLKFIGKSDPWLHFKAVRIPILTAFSTSSSGATLSLTMESVEKNDGVSTKVTSFTLPLGATMNMDGTALYECVAAMFIAQAYGVDLGFLDQTLVVVTALLASIGAAAIPMAGLVMLSIILTAVGLPLEGVGLILAVDRILDMFRTSINVWSDTCGAVIIAKTEGETLKV
ncbi:MAG: dicarboxylate/amino acid:cation symporter [Bacteroidetes bacterium 4572_128]|nr:MAG: dicarboxylate/amino acid:cation symporter [Bacteroidetes bacterium 4572_128]